MKLAYAVGTPDTHGKMLAYRGNFGEICADVNSIGYTGLELFVRDPSVIDRGVILKNIEAYDLEVVAVGTGPVVSEDKLTFCSPDESIRVAAIKRTKTIIDFASLFGAQVNVGKLRGDLQPNNNDQSWRWMENAFQVVCEYAQTKNVNIAIEPQNRFVINNLNTTQQALKWIRELNWPNLYLMLDVFHMNIEDQSIAASLIDAREYNVYLHFADNNRGVPGSGHIDFPEVIRILKALQYERYIGLEIDQMSNSYYAAKTSFAYLHSILKED